MVGPILGGRRPHDRDRPLVAPHGVFQPAEYTQCVAEVVVDEGDADSVNRAGAVLVGKRLHDG